MLPRGFHGHPSSVSFLSVHSLPVLGPEGWNPDVGREGHAPSEASRARSQVFFFVFNHDFDKHFILIGIMFYSMSA